MMWDRRLAFRISLHCLSSRKRKPIRATSSGVRAVASVSFSADRQLFNLTNQPYGQMHRANCAIRGAMYFWRSISNNLVDAMAKSGTTTGRMKPGQIIFGAAKVECTIRNMTSFGALLEPLSRASIPDQFVLLDVPIASRTPVASCWVRATLSELFSRRAIGSQFNFAVAACCGCSSVFSEASIALRRSSCCGHLVLMPTALRCTSRFQN